MPLRDALSIAFSSGRPLLLDAAMGTELARRGADTRPPLWSARALRAAPELVKAIHAENVAAGADVLTANTFRLHRRNLEREPGAFLPEGGPPGPRLAGVKGRRPLRGARSAPLTPDSREQIGQYRRLQQQPPDSSSLIGGRFSCRRTTGEMKDSLSRRLIAKAVALARDAASAATSPARQIWIAGSLAPLEDCYRPDLVPDDSALAWEHREMAEALAEAGVDLILVETMNCVRELVAAARAALATGLPVVASMVTDGAGRLLSGEPMEQAARTLFRLDPAPGILGLNCIPARTIGRDLARLRAAAPRAPLAVYANTGRALDEAAGLFTDPISPEAYARLAAGWLATGGVALLGGCCGTTAAHTLALRPLV